MTSLNLLLWIMGGIFLQLFIYLGISFGQHWVNYQSLRLSVASGDSTAQPGLELVATENLAAAWSGWREFRVTHKVIEDAAQDICSFYLVPQDEQVLPSFLPGQYLTFQLDIPSADGRMESMTRCYSLSDAPRSNGYRVSIKLAHPPENSAFPPGRASHYWHETIHVGSVLKVRAPAGHFYLDHSDTPVVLVGGGIGITPMLSMLNWALAAQPGREIWLFYGVSSGLELMARSHLEAMADIHPNFHLNICLSKPDAHEVLGKSYQHHGRIHVDLFRRLLPLKPFHFYICGPTPMLESLVPALEDWGVPDAHIHFEAFGPASVKRKTAVQAANSAIPTAVSGSPVTVTFSQSGRQVPWHAGCGSLLDLAEAQGISIPSGCRAGGCGSCQTTIQSGEVVYQNPPDFDPEPGTCLMCVCTPQTNVTLEL